MEKAKVVIMEMDDDSNHKVEMEMPGPPFIGLRVRIPWRRYDYCAITHICWNEEKGYYEAFVDT